MTAAGKSFSRIDSYRFARELMAESPEYSFADAMEQGICCIKGHDREYAYGQ